MGVTEGGERGQRGGKGRVEMTGRGEWRGRREGRREREGSGGQGGREGGVWWQCGGGETLGGLGMTPKARVIVAIVRQFNTIESDGYWISAFIAFAPITSLHACMYACYVCVCCVCLFVCCVNMCVCTCVYVCLRVCVCKVYGIYMCVSVCMWEKGMESRGQLCFEAIVRRCMHHKWAPLIVYVWVSCRSSHWLYKLWGGFLLCLCVFSKPLS